MSAPPRCDPIVDLGVSYVLESNASVTADQVVSLRSALSSYVRLLISYSDVVVLLSPILPSTQPIDRIERILRTPPVPLPPCRLPPDQAPIGPRAKARTWSSYEDQRLLAGIHRFGTSDWAIIANFVGNSRTKAQCYQRWARGLDPNINKTRWTPEQDAQLLMFVQIFGDRSWSKVSAELGNRCDVQCRYRYRQLMKDARFPAMQRQAIERAQEFARTSDMKQVARTRAPLTRLPALSHIAPDFVKLQAACAQGPPIVSPPQAGDGNGMQPQKATGRVVVPLNPPGA